MQELPQGAIQQQRSGCEPQHVHQVAYEGFIGSKGPLYGKGSEREGAIKTAAKTAFAVRSGEDIADACEPPAYILVEAQGKVVVEDIFVPQRIGIQEEGRCTQQEIRQPVMA